MKPRLSCSALCQGLSGIVVGFLTSPVHDPDNPDRNKLWYKLAHPHLADRLLKQQSARDGISLESHAGRRVLRSRTTMRESRLPERWAVFTSACRRQWRTLRGQWWVESHFDPDSWVTQNSEPLARIWRHTWGRAGGPLSLFPMWQISFSWLFTISLAYWGGLTEPGLLALPIQRLWP